MLQEFRRRQETWLWVEVFRKVFIGRRNLTEIKISTAQRRCSRPRNSRNRGKEMGMRRCVQVTGWKDRWCGPQGPRVLSIEVN